MSSNVPTSSVVVVEIDTRNGQYNTLFESSVENQTEHAIQFWKTLTLSPHIESSLYSKEILQSIKQNTLKPMSIDNSKKPIEPDPKTEEYLKEVETLNQMDEMMKIKMKSEKIEKIRQMHRNRKEKTNQLNSISRTDLLKSESESRWVTHLNDSMDIKNNNNKICEDDYEIDINDLNDELIVKDLSD